MNVATLDDWYLSVGWLLMAFRPQGPYPVLVLHGEQGTAKSTTARVLRELVDPSEAMLRSQPRDVRDLMIGARNNWVVNFDNLSYLQPWLSDALCRVSTGGGFSTRQLYTDADEFIFAAQRPVILNGIEELATRGDLLDRSVVMYLPRISSEDRRAEAEFWPNFNEARPRIFGAVLDAVASAAKNVDTVELDASPRRVPRHEVRSGARLQCP